MEDPKKHRNETQERRSKLSAEAVSRWLVVSLLHDPQLQEVRIRLRQTIQPADTAELEGQGCHRMTLLDTIACGRRLYGLYPPSFTARKLRQYASYCDKVREGVTKLAPDPRSWITGLDFDDAAGRVIIRTSGDPDGCSWYNSQLADALFSQAARYRELATMCHSRQLPRRENIARIGYIWPVVYVDACCREPHFRRVSELLYQAGNGKPEEQLRRTFNDLRDKQPWVLDWIKKATRYLGDTGGILLTSYEFQLPGSS